MPPLRPGAGQAVTRHEPHPERPAACSLRLPERRMIREHADVAVLGAGVAGSLMSLVLQRIGRRAVLLERGSHPRFAIGESSTPLANLVLEELSRAYDLPRLFPLTEYGRWQQAYPHMAVGLKRG